MLTNTMISEDIIKKYLYCDLGFHLVPAMPHPPYQLTCDQARKWRVVIAAILTDKEIKAQNSESHEGDIRTPAL